MSETSTQRNANNGLVFLPGCGVEFVSWVQVSTAEAKSASMDWNPIEEMRRLHAASNNYTEKGCRRRALRNLVRNGIDDPEKLANADVNAWRSFGTMSRIELEKMAESFGLKLR